MLVRRNYYRLQDLKQLREAAASTPLLIEDDGGAFVVRVLYPPAAAPETLFRGRYQVVYAFINGYARAFQGC